MHNNDDKKPTGRPAFATRRDVLIIAALAVLALGLLALWYFGRGTPEGGADGGASEPRLFARVSVGFGDDTTVQAVELDTDALLEIDAALPVHLEVRDGAIRFVDSVCPDHTCEGFGWLRHEGGYALCAPAGVSVRIVYE